MSHAGHCAADPIFSVKEHRTCCSATTAFCRCENDCVSLCTRNV